MRSNKNTASDYDPEIQSLMPNRIVSHAGGGDKHPMNSLDGILWAAELGVERIEIDVRRTADDVLVLHHDASFTDAVGDTKLISKTQNQDLTGAHFDCSIATLDEVCEVLVTSDVVLVIDLKSEPKVSTHRKLIEQTFVTVDKYDLRDRAVYHSDSIDLIRELLSLNKEAITGAGVGMWHEKFDPARICKELENLHYHNIREAQFCAISADILPVENFDVLFAQAEKMGLVSGVWTINQPDRIKEWLETPIRYLTTAVPADALDISKSQTSLEQ